MPIPIANAIRQQLVDRHAAGEPLKKVSQELGVPYESARKVWRRWREKKRIDSDYSGCGREMQSSRRGYRGALMLRRLHPMWGAPLIRQLLQEK
jgi:hypothetical protein